MDGVLWLVETFSLSPARLGGLELTNEDQRSTSSER